MKIVADENVAKPIVDRLRQAGHEVMYITEISPAIADDEVLKVASQGGALLLTDDKDFGELVYHQHQQTLGVLYIRLPKLSNSAKANTIEQVLTNYGAQLINAFSVVTPHKIRIRQPPTP